MTKKQKQFELAVFIYWLAGEIPTGIGILQILKKLKANYELHHLSRRTLLRLLLQCTNQSNSQEKNESQ